MANTGCCTPLEQLCEPCGFAVSVEELALGGVSFHDLAEHFAARPDFALLDSRGTDDDSLAAHSFLTFAPFARFTTKDGVSTLRVGHREQTVTGDPFRSLQHVLESWRVRPGGDACSIPFVGGAIGYFSYELGRQLEVLPRAAVDDLGCPDAYVSFYNFAVALHRRSGRMYLCHLEPQGERLGLTRDVILAELQAVAAGAYQEPQFAKADGRPAGEFRSELSEAAYLAAVRRIKEYIYAGDVYQVNMTQRFRAPVSHDASWSVYKQLAAINPAPFAAYLNCEGHTVASSSPERFLRVDRREVETRPIKGTFRRGATPDEDAHRRMTLFRSPKNRAELAMIVDLLRNDIGRVCAPGSVHVCAFPRVETYASVHHLVATITGELGLDVGVVDVIKATFPGGSITGAPKIRAMEIIDELEPVARGVYTGCIGYVSFDGRADLNIAIRTIVFKDGMAHVHAGGGIVADSDPSEEYEELLLKADKLFQAVRLATTLRACA